MLSKERLHQLFQYENGNLFWKVRPAYNVFVGDKAGHKTQNGYITINIDKKPYGAHRLIFLMYYGYLPKIVDHIDHNRSNNVISNLRAADYISNGLNRQLGGNNSSGYKNVMWNKAKKNWRVALVVDKKFKHIGNFEDIELADLVAQEARNKYHGKFAHHGH